MQSHDQTVESYLIPDLQVPITHKVRILLKRTSIGLQVTVGNKTIHQLLERYSEQIGLQLNKYKRTKNVISTVVAV
jgi:hypothetical protein